MVARSSLTEFMYFALSVHRRMLIFFLQRYLSKARNKFNKFS